MAPDAAGSTGRSCDFELLEPEGDLYREGTLELVAQNGLALKRVPERYLSDPDIVLAAVANRPEAMLAASKSLRGNVGFAVEAVLRNWRVLKHLEAHVRSEREVLVAAARQGEKALALALGKAQADNKGLEEEALRASTLSRWIMSYEGECLRLVGHCNYWRTTESLLRFKCVRPSTSSGWPEMQATRSSGLSAGSRARPRGTTPGPSPQDVRRHALTVYLRSGYLSFQVLSCTQQYDFRIFPLTVDRYGFFALKAGDASSVEAAVGREKDGHNRNFFIEEERGAIVTIFVEVLVGFTVSWAPPGPEFWQFGTVAGAARCAASVWYVVETCAHCREGGLLTLSQKSDREKPFVEEPTPAALVINGVNLTRTRIMEDVDVRREDFEDLVWQALSISKRTFDVDEAEMLGLFSDDTHLTLLVDEAGQTTLGYCHYFLYNNKGALHFWVEFLVVAEPFRGKDQGKALMRWVLSHAEDAGCRAISLHSREPKLPWYRSLGFDVVGKATDKGLWPMELVLPQRAWVKS